jgi:riboflavin kinase/FMN adenylyltransferase
MEEAAELLGRFWSLEGRVMRGNRRGHKLGFPTANLDLGESAQPALGVYAVKVRVPGRKSLCNGVANVGVRPSFGRNLQLCVEAHLLRFNQSLYGKKIEVFFVKYLRTEKRFRSPESLKKQIRADIEKTRAVFQKQRVRTV